MTEQCAENETDLTASAGDPAVAADVHHAADLIKRKREFESWSRHVGRTKWLTPSVVRDSLNPEKALNFNHLYSRLLSQPVLNQKWAMLYFIYQLSDNYGHPALQESRPLAANRLPTFHESLESSRQSRSPEPISKRQLDRQFVVDSPAFNEAFSNAGILRLPTSEGPTSPRLDPPVSRQKKDRPKEDKPANGHAEPPSPDEPQKWSSITTLEPTEPAMLRDLPFTLQGLSSTNFAFATPKTLQLPTTLPAPIIGLLHTLAEPCLLYKNLQSFVDSSEGGLIGQSFKSALGNELRSYLGLVASLEGQIRRALAMLDENEPRRGIGKAGVTLKRCVVWMKEATMGLRLMSLMVEESKGLLNSHYAVASTHISADKMGGQLISSIHSFSQSHGDPFVISFAERLLTHITRPFYDMLRQWIYDGELSDPYLEFFVSEQQDKLDESGGDRKSGATSVWEEKYTLNSPMVPTIITETFAKKVFLIGKSLNFIRHGCNDATWVESYSKSASRELRYGDIATLETSIDEAYKTTMARLIDLMATRFHLFDHLNALKKYLLLGAGDFIAVLLESLSSNLDRPANTQYRHTLTAQLEHAVRNSNAQYDSADVRSRLDSRMLELSHGEIGWDVFTLEYKISPPVDVIITPFASKQYLKIFNLLWRVKRVEYSLNTTWRKCMTGARSFLSSIHDKLGRDWKSARCAVAEMVHFVNQLQYYILFEVIESSWAQLLEALHKPESTLDDMIAAHAAYLTSITRKGLLGSGGPIDFTHQLHELLKTMLAYKDAVDSLYSFSVAEYTRRQEVSAKIETRTAAGKWGLSERDDDPDSPNPATSAKSRLTDATSPLLAVPGAHGGASEEDQLGNVRTRLTALAADFKARVNILLGDLMSQPDADMRWLAMVMNFNDVYQPVRRKKRAVAGMEKSVKGKERESVRVAQKAKDR